MNRQLKAGVWSVLVIAICSCTSGRIDDRPAGEWPGDIEIEVISPPDGGAPACPVWAGVLLALLDSDPGVERPGLRIAFGCARERGAVSVHAAVEMTVAVEDEPEASFEGYALGPCDSCEGGWGLLAALQTGGVVREAVEGAMAVRQVTTAPDEEIVRILSSAATTRAGVVLAAIGQAGDRRLGKTVRPLTGLLDSGDRNVVLRAVGALGRIGDPAPLKALGRLSLSPAPELPYAAMQAIEDIGGRDAMRVLGFVADQAPDPVIVREARDHIDRLKGDSER